MNLVCHRQCDLRRGFIGYSDRVGTGSGFVQHCFERVLTVGDSGAFGIPQVLEVFAGRSAIAPIGGRQREVKITIEIERDETTLGNAGAWNLNANFFANRGAIRRASNREGRALRVCGECRSAHCSGAYG